jgi:hypothetical protein
MGWGRTLLLGDIGNRLDIKDTENDIARLKRQISGSFRKDMSQDRKLDALAAENAELKLYLAATIRLLTAKDIVTVKELKAMVDAIDAEDGRKGGKFSGEMLEE